MPSKEAELAVGKFCSFVDSALFNTTYARTVLSWASTHGHSQLKHQNLRVGGCTEEMLKWLNYIPVQGPTLDAKLAARGYQINLPRHFVRALLRPARQWRKLQSEPTRALLPSL